MTSAKITIYPNLRINSLILEREEWGRISLFFRKKGRAKNLPVGKAGLGHGGGGGGGGLIVQMESWLAFRRDASGRCMATKE
jgi:hypothetical protein